MSNLLFHWQRDNYQNDRRIGFEFNLNQNSPQMQLVEKGESVWAFTRRSDGAYVLAARLVVEEKGINPPSHQYGKYRVAGSPTSSVYFDLEGQLDITPLIKSLVSARAAILGRSFQGHSGVRSITSDNHNRLLAYSSNIAAINPQIIIPQESVEKPTLDQSIGVQTQSERPNADSAPSEEPNVEITLPQPDQEDPSRVRSNFGCTSIIVGIPFFILLLILM